MPSPKRLEAIGGDGGSILSAAAAGKLGGKMPLRDLAFGDGHNAGGSRAYRPRDFATMAVVFFLIAAIACWLPARRAANLDPTMALCDE